jgi:hypothetical protein
MANAFEVPVQPRELGLIASSVKSLDRHWKSITDMYGNGGAQPFVVVNNDVANQLESLKPSQCSNVDDLVEKTLATINEGWSSGSKG